MAWGRGGRIVCIGECMVEFAPRQGGDYRQGFAGDTFNTAWYLARLLPRGWQVDYLTALGEDALSGAMVDFMARSGIGTTHVARLPGLAPGLYVIALEAGERRFAYWRGQSAARHLADDPERLARALKGADLAVFSGITVAILPVPGRRALLAALAAARGQGARIVFDPNIRPALWPEPAKMRHWLTRAARLSDLVLPSFEDEARAFGDATPQDTAQRYLALGARHVVVKNGAGEGFWHARGETGRFQPPAVANPVDTTAAGDAFNAGFLAALAGGAGAGQAVARAARLAARVIQAPGALVPV